MFWFFCGVVLLCLGLLPVRLTGRIRRLESRQIQLQLQVSPVRITRTYGLIHTPAGRRLYREDRHGRHLLHTAERYGIPFGKALLHSSRARRFLLRHLHLVQLDGWLLFAPGDAARSALIAGGLQSLIACLQCRSSAVRLQVLPDFFRPHTTLDIRCIIRFRLGIIILTAGLLLPELVRMQQATESEVTAYGTPHR